MPKPMNEEILNLIRKSHSKDELERRLKLTDYTIHEIIWGYFISVVFSQDGEKDSVTGLIRG